MTDQHTAEGAPAARSAADRWRRLPAWARWVLGGVAAVLAVNVALAGLSSVTGGAGPGGPRSSSYATSAEGLAAYAELVGGAGHPVRHLRAPLDKAALDPGDTVVVADAPHLTADEARALARFVAAGGRLVAAGEGAGALAGALTGRPVTTTPGDAVPAGPIVPVPEVAGVAKVEGDGGTAFDDAGATLPVLGGRDGVLATVATVGQGRVVAVADPSPLQNRHLAHADNAAFGLDVVGAPGRPVLFAETPHGYGAGKGWSALPAEWRWAVMLGVVAVAVAMWARGRRLGEAEVLERPLPPARRAYVDALASTLSRTRQPAEAMAPLQAAARRRLVARAALPPDAGPAELLAAAARAGIPDDEAAALVAPAHTDAAVLAAGRALARLEGAGR